MSSRTSRNAWSKDSMLTAVDLVKNGLMSVRKAALVYKIPRSTLGDRVSGKVSSQSRYGTLPKFTHEEERTLINLAADRAEYGVGFSKKNFMRYVGEYADRKGVPFVGGFPTEKWWRNMKSRHGDISLRTPESTAAVRHDSMTRERTLKYFECLRKELSAKGILDIPEKIWNMDETYLSLSTDPDKIVARKGAKYLHAKSGSRENITLIVCGNATGRYLNPHLLFKGKTKGALKSWDSDHAPAGTRLSVSPTGWMKQGLSLLWFKEVFLPNIGSDRPQVLIFDGHDSHHHVELIHEARSNGITLIEIPSHCSNWLQPLDRTVFGSFKSSWKSLVQSFTSSTGCTVSHSNFFLLFNQAWNKLVSNRILLTSGFRAAGICPFNPAAIPDQAYLPANIRISDENVTTAADKEMDLEMDLDMEMDMNFQAHDLEEALVTVQDLGISLLPDGSLVLNSPPMELSQDDYFGEPLDLYEEMREEPLEINKTAEETKPQRKVRYIPPKPKRQEFFIITSDDAFQEKVRAAKVKEEKEKKKQERLQKREEKNAEKQNKKEKN